MKKALAYSFGLMALYVAVNQYTGTSSVMTAGAGAGSQLIRSFEGR